MIVLSVNDEKVKILMWFVVLKMKMSIGMKVKERNVILVELK
jgi:hypothetical protein